MSVTKSFWPITWLHIGYYSTFWWSHVRQIIRYLYHNHLALSFEIPLPMHDSLIDNRNQRGCSFCQLGVCGGFSLSSVVVNAARLSLLFCPTRFKDRFLSVVLTFLLDCCCLFSLWILSSRYVWHVAGTSAKSLFFHSHHQPGLLFTTRYSTCTCALSAFVLHDVWCLMMMLLLLLLLFYWFVLLFSQARQSKRANCAAIVLLVGGGSLRISFLAAKPFLGTRSGLIVCCLQSLVNGFYAQRNLTLDKNFIEIFISIDKFSYVLLIDVYWQEKQILLSLHEQHNQQPPQLTQ